MATACDVASPLCAWLVAACMSAACGGGTDSVSRRDKWRRSAASWTGGVGLRRSTRRFAISGKARAVALQPEKAVIEKKKPDENRRRVVVTGLGVVTPLGHDPDVFYNNLLEGVSGISEIESFDCSSFPTRIAGEIKSFSSDGWVEPKLARRSDEIKRQLDKTKCGVLIGSAMGGMKVFSDAIEALEVSCRKDECKEKDFNSMAKI